MGRMLINNKKLAIIFYHPVGIKNLSDQTMPCSCFLIQKPFILTKKLHLFSNNRHMRLRCFLCCFRQRHFCFLLFFRSFRHHCPIIFILQFRSTLCHRLFMMIRRRCFPHKCTSWLSCRCNIWFAVSTLIRIRCRRIATACCHRWFSWKTCWYRMSRLWICRWWLLRFLLSGTHSSQSLQLKRFRTGFLFFFFPVRLFLVFQRNGRYQLPVFQHCTDNIINFLIYSLILIKPQFHFSRMHIDIDQCRINFNMKGRKRIFVNHDKCLISILYRLCNNIALDITAVNKIILPGTITPG